MKSMVFPGKFILGSGILGSVGEYADALGTKFFVIGSNSTLGAAKEKIPQGLKDGKTAEFEKFNGECSKVEIARLVEKAKADGCDCIMGIGGGKLLDTSKAVAYTMGIPVVIIPTIAATDAPCSALSVVYTEDHVFEEYLWLPSNPNIVMVDIDMILKAPARYLIAGMGDAMATYFEARAVKNSDSNTCAVSVPAKQALAALDLANLCYKTLLSEGTKALCAVESGVVTPSLEAIIEANVLLSGIGFESGGLAAAHAIHNGLTVLEQTHDIYHGEKVAFATITQLMLEDAPMEELLEVVNFCKSVGLPTTFAEIGLDGVSDEDLMKAAEASAVEGETIHCEPFEVNADKVFAAMKAADAFGRKFK